MEQVMVVGPMSSGVRLMRDILAVGGVVAWIDLSHGTQDLDWYYPDGTLGRIVVMQRNWKAVQRSSDAAWDGYAERVTTAKSRTGIAQRYKEVGLHVKYEDLCDKTDLTINKIAHWLGITPWTATFAITNKNEKWL